MTTSARRLDRILADTPLAAGLLARLAATRVAAHVIAPLCAQLVPDFDPSRPGCCDLREHTLRIWPHSSAHANKLRQAIPRLQARLRDRGIEVNEIKVGVQLGRLRAPAVGSAPNKDPSPAQAKGSMVGGKPYLLGALSFSSKLALTSTDSPLGQAAARLRAAVEARLARMRESDQSFDE
jgi:hypothetical protein